VTWQDYEADLGRNLEDLHGRVHRGAYRPQPSRRTYIPKADGRQRPLAIAALEDKIVQGACTMALNAIYEEDFLGFSYGFRPGRGPHDALDALSVAITSRKVNHILDADVRDFFGSVNHDWLIRFLEHRIGDKRIIRLIRKWLKAGILEDGVVTVAGSGTGQGSVISPLLGNIYLHYVFDLWAERWRRQEARGDIIVVRYADDLVVGALLLLLATFLGKLRGVQKGLHRCVELPTLVAISVRGEPDRASKTDVTQSRILSLARALL
jgi:RNA-directed DNA polymerase